MKESETAEKMFERAVRLMDTDHEREGFEMFRRAAEAGSVKAWYEMGNCYGMGIGTAPDHDKAGRCYQKAAEGKDPDGMFALAVSYEEGVFTEKDLVKAFDLAREAARLGNADALAFTGFCYEKGNGVEKDMELAIACYQRACEQGSEGAAKAMAIHYSNGTGVPKDPDKAREILEQYVRKGSIRSIHAYISLFAHTDEERFIWTLKAAEAGSTGDYMQVAIDYSQGIGTKKDLKKAAYWIRKLKEANEKERKREEEYTGV